MELWDTEAHWVVSSAREAGLVNGYDHPNRLGADRWVALIGARARLLASGPPRPALVVMIGTAATVDAIDAEGRFLGGLILLASADAQGAGDGYGRLEVPTGEVVDFHNTSDD
jgi:type III pantothenate kinase